MERIKPYNMQVPCRYQKLFLEFLTRQMTITIVTTIFDGPETI